jgi:hypothetical protein
MTLVNQGEDTRGYNQKQNHQQNGNEQYEGIVVADPHAIVNPGTVVVEALHTYVADGAVLATRRSYHLAVRTHFARVNFF